MTKYHRAKQRIARDKAAKEAKRKLRYASNDSFQNVITMQHMCASVMKCKRGVGWKEAVQDYMAHAIVEMHSAVCSLRQTKLPSYANTKRMTIYERGKIRDIVPITIRDRILQRALCDYALVPVITSNLIYDNGASIKNKGIAFTRERLHSHLMCAVKEFGTEFYALVFDFKGFFDSIEHRICLDILDRNFDDRYIKGLTMAIIKSYAKAAIKDIKDEHTKSELLRQLDSNQMNGICLGSQVSQIIALAVPNELDHFIKDICGVRHYVRYMDDGVILSDDKEFLQSLLIQMNNICVNLGLHFNTKKTRVVKASRGFSFLKIHYRITPTGKIVHTLTRDGIVRMRRKLKKFRRMVDDGRMSLDDVYNSMQSWMAHSEVAMSYYPIRNMLRLYNELFDGYRITKKWRYTDNSEYHCSQSEFFWDAA